MFLSTLFLSVSLFSPHGNGSVSSNEQDSPILLHRALTLYDDTRNGEKTFFYRHNNTLSGDIYLFNCYGFVNHLLEAHAPKSLLEIQVFMESDRNLSGANLDGSNTPCPLHYIGFYQSLLEPRNSPSFWQRIEDFTELLPGDLLFYDNPKLNLPDHGQHIMIIQQIHPLKENIIPITLLHTTGLPTSASIGMGLYQETKTFQLDENNNPTHIRCSPEGNFLQRRIGVIRLK